MILRIPRILYLRNKREGSNKSEKTCDWGGFVRDGEPPEKVEALAHEQERLVTGEERLSGS